MTYRKRQAQQELFLDQCLDIHFRIGDQIIDIVMLEFIFRYRRLIGNQNKRPSQVYRIIHCPQASLAYHFQLTADLKLQGWLAAFRTISRDAKFKLTLPREQHILQSRQIRGADFTMNFKRLLGKLIAVYEMMFGQGCEARSGIFREKGGMI